MPVSTVSCRTVVARISGLVTYANGSKGQFAGTLDERGRVSFNGPSSDSAGNMAEVDSDTNWLDVMVALVPRLVFSPEQSDAKVVTAMVADFSGRVSIANPDVGKPTWEDFHLCFWMQKDDSGSILGAFKDAKSAVPVGSGDLTPWAKVLGDDALIVAMGALLQPLGLSIAPPE